MDIYSALDSLNGRNSGIVRLGDNDGIGSGMDGFPIQSLTSRRQTPS